jgi:uncharacterized protein with beta-barrel porin domain
MDGAPGSNGTLGGANGTNGADGYDGTTGAVLCVNGATVAGGNGGMGGSAAPLGTYSNGYGGQGGSGGTGGVGVGGTGFSLTNGNGSTVMGGAGGDGGAGGQSDASMSSALPGAYAAGNGGSGGAGGAGGPGVSGDLITMTNYGTVLGGEGGVGGQGGHGGNGGNYFSTFGGIGGTGAGGGAGGAGISGQAFGLVNNGTITGGTGGAGGAGGSGGDSGDDPAGPGGFGGGGGSGGPGVSGSGFQLTDNGAISGGAGAAGGAAGTPGTSPNGAITTIAGVVPTAGGFGSGGVGVVSTGSSTVTVTSAGSVTGGLSGDGTTRADAVEFSGGGNTLTLEPGAQITGTIVSSSGSASGGDTLILAGSGSLDLDGSPVSGFAMAQKTGAGTWTLTGTNSGQDWLAGSGTLQVGNTAASGSLGGVGGAEGAAGADCGFAGACGNINGGDGSSVTTATVTGAQGTGISVAAGSALVGGAGGQGGPAGSESFYVYSGGTYSSSIYFGMGGKGGDAAAAVDGSGFSLNNSGTIAGGVGGAGGNYSGTFTGKGLAGNGGAGVSGNAFSVTNAGAILGGTGGVGGPSGGTGGAGVYGSRLSLVNAGSITGGVGGTSDYSGIAGLGGNGVFSTGGSSTIVDSGTITGGAGSPGVTGGMGAPGSISSPNGGNGSNGAAGGSAGVGVGGTGFTLTLTSTGVVAGGVGGSGGAGGRGGNGYLALYPPYDSHGNGGDGGNGGNGGNGGVGVSGAGFVLTNAGAVTGGDGGAAGQGGAGGLSFGLGTNGKAGAAGVAGLSGGVGIVSTGGSTIVTSGNIAGGTGVNGQADAVALSAGDNTLTLEAGYSFTGNVVSTSSTANGGDTLVLGGDTSSSAAFDATNLVSTMPGSYTGTQYVGFNQLEKAGTSTWMLTGTTTVATPWTVDGGTLEIAQSGALGTGTVTVDNTANQNATLTIDSGVSLTNQPVTLNNGATLNNAGSITNTKSLAAVKSDLVGATVNNVQGGRIAGNDGIRLGQGGTVRNAGGSIIAGTSLVGVWLGASGAITNDASTIAGDEDGVVLTRGGTVDNGAGAVIKTTGAQFGDCNLGFDCAIVVLTSAGGGSGGALTLSNAGSIIGNVQMDPTASNVTTLTAGGSIAGDLDIGANTASTLTLGGSNTTAQLYSDAVTGTTTFAGALTKAGTGTWVIDSDDLSTVSGTTISAGTLQIGNGGAMGSVGNADIVDNGALVFERNNALTFAGAISGNGSVQQDGADGTTTLDGINTYTGSTTVTAGTLLVGDATHTTASIAGGATVQSDATLGGFGTVGATSTTTEIASGGVLSPGAGSGSVGTLAIGGDLTLDAGSVLDYDLGTPASPNPFATAGAGDSVNVAGMLAFGGAATLNLADAGGMGPGLYNLASYGTLATTGCSFSGGIACLTLGTVPGGTQASYYTIVNNASASQIDLYNTAGQALNIWAPTSATSVGGTGTWSATSPTWTDTSGDGLSKMVPQPGFAIFQGTQCANAACTVTVDDDAGDVSVTGMQFAVDGYTLAGDAVTLVDDSSGNAPIIEVGDGSSNSVNMTATIANKLDTSGAGFNKTGAGTLVLDGGFGGTLVNGTVGVQGGTLQLGKGDTSQPVLRSALVMSSGTNLLLSNGVIENANNYSGAVVSGQNFNVTLQTTGSTGLSSIGSAFSVRGMAAIDGTGFTLTLGGNSYVAGGYGAMGSGGGAGGAGGAGVAGAGFTVNNSSAGAGPGGYGNGIYGGAGGRTATTGAGGAGGIAISGTDFTVVNSGNIFGGEGGLTYTGNTASPGLGGAAIGGSGFALTNTGAVTGGAGGYVSSFAGTTSGVAGGVGVYSTGNSTVINEGTISGGLSGDGTAQADAIDFTGGGNTLELVAGHPGTFNGAISVTRAAGDPADTLELGGDSGSGTFDLSQLASGGEFSGFNAEAKSGASTWTLTGTGSTAENWTIDGGTLVGDITALQGNVAFAPASGATATVEFNQGSGNANSTPNGIFAGVISGAGNVTKSGDGALVLTGDNTFTGGTTVGDGLLQIGDGTVNGSLGTGAISVADTGELAFMPSPTQPVTFGNAISGGAMGMVHLLNAGTLTYTGQSTGPQWMLLSGGTLNVGDGNGDGAITGGMASGMRGMNNMPASAVSFMAAGGTVNVATGASVTGGMGGIGVSGAMAFALDNQGTIAGGDAGMGGMAGVGVVAAGGANIANAGAMAGGKNADGSHADAVEFSGGGNTLTLEVGSTETGNIVGSGIAGSGGDALVLGDDTLGSNPAAGGSNALDMGNVSGFAAFRKTGTSTWTLTGTNTEAVPWSIVAGTVIDSGSGTGALGSGAITDNGTLVFDRSDAVTLTQTIAGSGVINQSNPIIFTVNGDGSAFNGATNIAAGNLVVGDDAHTGAVLGGMVDIAKGATISGAGTVGGLDLSGTLLPGDPGLGTLHVSGDATFESGSTFQLTATPTGAAGKLAVGGQVDINGGNTLVMAQPGNWAPRTQYTIITAGKGVSGTFAGVSDDQAFLTPSLAYGANAVTLTLLRNNINFGTVATTPNEKGVAAGIEGFGFGNVLYAAVVKLNAADARTAFDQTSGEYHASEQAARVDDSRYVREAMNQRLRAGDVDPEATRVGHLTAWAHAWGHWGTQDGDGNVAKLSDNGDGLLVGADLPVGTQGRIGVTGGTGRNSLSVKDRNAWGRDTSTWLGLYGGYDLNAFSLRGGLAYAWDQIPTHRQIAFQGYTDRLSGNVTGHTLTGFIEGAWTFHFNGGTVSPFLNLAHTKVTTAASTEDGGAAALHAYAAGENVSFSTLGARGQLNLADHFNLHGELGWQHAFGDTTPAQNLGFVAGGPTFTEYGVPIAKNAGLGRIGLGWHQGKVAIDADYEGLRGGGTKDQAAKLSVSVRF